MKKVLMIDTSFMCVWLQVPGMETCGPDDNRWDYKRVDTVIKKEINENATLILPWATIIETGNHIAQANGSKYKVIGQFVDYIFEALDGNRPWAAFMGQSGLLEKDALRNTLDRWRETAIGGQSLGDALIVDVAKYYEAYAAEVVILTGDEGLKAYEPSPKRMIPRRRR